MSVTKKAVVHRFAHEAMATVFEVIIAGREKEYAGQAARAAFAEVDRLERLFSRFDLSSEISRIGRLEPGESLSVGLETAQVLGLSSFIQTETDGAFDINYRAGGRPGRGRPAAAPKALSKLVRVAHTGRGFEVTRLPGPVKGGLPGLDLDLEAVGKGYALDAALAALNASLFAACILPLSTAYTICEGLGWESGVNTWASMYRCEAGTSGSVVSWITSIPGADSLSSRSGRGLQTFFSGPRSTLGAANSRACPNRPTAIAPTATPAAPRKKSRRVRRPVVLLLRCVMGCPPQSVSSNPVERRHHCLPRCLSASYFGILDSS